MARFLALIAALFMVPFGVYAGGIIALRRRLPVRADWTLQAIVALCLVGGVLTATGLVMLASSSGSSTDAPYRPAQIRDGVIVPGGFGDE